MKPSSANRHPIAGSIVAGLTAMIFLTGCASYPWTTPDTAVAPSTKPITATTKMSPEQLVTQAECKTMHDAMMAKMAAGEMMKDGSMQPGHMMTPEMKAKHKTCMEMMPEMQSKCEQMKQGGEHPGAMGDGEMHRSCLMMETEPQLAE